VSGAPDPSLDAGDRELIAGLPLSDAQRDLVGSAVELLRSRAAVGRHEVAAALRTKAGAVHRGLHVESSIGPASICAEGAAIAAAAAAGDTEIEAIVAVLDTGEDGEGWRVVTPCGLCRELISDYAPAATVIDYDAGREPAVKPVPVGELLPGKTTRRWAGR
jgi:cytidine deaminase